MKPLRILALFALSGAAWAQYQPYVNTTFCPGYPYAGPWAVTGDYVYCYSSSGLVMDGSSVMTPVYTPPGGWGDYEVRATISSAGSGTEFILYARMSQDKSSYYSLEIDCAASGCTSANLYKVIGGNYTQLASYLVPYSTFEARLVVHQSTIITYVTPLVQTTYVSGPTPSIVEDSALPSGGPGIGGRGGYISKAQVGPVDTIAPDPIDTSTIETLNLENAVALQWAGVSDDPDGIGVSQYVVYRNGAYIGSAWPQFINGAATPGQQVRFTDETATPGQQATYQIYAQDWHLNQSATGEPYGPLTVAAYGSTTPVRTGTRPNGAYWGGAGEQIDMLSGNLNYSTTLVTAVGRTGWSVPFNLTYNSQIWLQNTGSCGGTSCYWPMGYDLGLGYGWRFEAGSIAPVWYGSTLDHFVYTDSTGAEYKLNQNPNNSNVWSTTEGVYVWYDKSAAALHFPDGSFWSMSVQSAADEPDAGTLYPSTMEDSNGNQITVTYMYAYGAATWNTSSRIQYISDARRQSESYSVLWTPGAYPAQIQNIYSNVGTAENYAFQFLAAQTLSDPAGSSVQYGTANLLYQVSVVGLSGLLPTTFTYTGAAAGTTGELAGMTTPLGGNLSWAYRTFNYTTPGLGVREVLTRYMTPISGGTQYSWSLNLDNSATSQHAYGIVTDSGVNTSKEWWFNSTPAWEAGLPSAYEEIDSGGNVLLRKEYGWAQGPAGAAYANALTSRLNYGAAYEADSKSTQLMDGYGNVTGSYR